MKAAALLLLSLFGAHGAIAQDAPLRALASGTHRSPEHRARNVYLHPVETLEFFGLQPDLTVVELFPGPGGWYTEILAPYLRDRGRYYAAIYQRDYPEITDSPGYHAGVNAAFSEKLAARPDLYGGALLTELGPTRQDIAPEGRADLVLACGSVHKWLAEGYAERVFAAAYRVLRPGGVLGIVEPRAGPGQSDDLGTRSGYVGEDAVIALARRAGFELDARSEINANPRDTKDHPQGAWSLPPALRGGDSDRAKYLAIGESDRMTLRFVRPDR
jgi:predicted methyltransferase